MDFYKQLKQRVAEHAPMAEPPKRKGANALKCARYMARKTPEERRELRARCEASRRDPEGRRAYKAAYMRDYHMRKRHPEQWLALHPGLALDTPWRTINAA